MVDWSWSCVTLLALEQAMKKSWSVSWKTDSPLYKRIELVGVGNSSTPARKIKTK